MGSRRSTDPVCLTGLVPWDTGDSLPCVVFSTGLPDKIEQSHEAVEQPRWERSQPRLIGFCFQGVVLAKDGICRSFWKHSYQKKATIVEVFVVF